MEKILKHLDLYHSLAHSRPVSKETKKVVEMVYYYTFFNCLTE